MKLNGTKDFEVELVHGEPSIRLTLRFTSTYEAALAYDDIGAAARKGSLRVNLSFGEVLEEENGSAQS